MIGQDTIRANVLWKPTRLHYTIIAVGGAYILAYLVARGVFGDGHGGFPESLRLGIQGPIDAVFAWTGSNLAWLLNPISGGIDSLLSGFKFVFLWLPWIVPFALTSLITLRLAGKPLALFATASLLLIGVWGLWDSAMITLSLMAVSVLFAVSLGIPLGIAAALSNRFQAWLRPILDTMQVMPAFVYIMPALFLFGVGGTVCVVLTVIYAIPPVIRLTNLGLRRVPTEITETAFSHGATRLQTLCQIQFPLAKPTILMGINQTIMMALAMVIITALVGESGLGRDVWNALRMVDSGVGFQAGLAIVFIAIIFDRLSYAVTKQGHADVGLGEEPRRILDNTDHSQITLASTTRLWLTVAAIGGVILLVAGTLIPGLTDFPAGLEYSIAGPINSAVDWIALNVFFATNWIKYDLIQAFGLAPIMAVMSWLPWPLIVLGSTALAYLLAGPKVATLTGVSVLFFGLTGVWDFAIQTLGQVIVAVAISVVAGAALGLWSSSNRTVEAVLRPVLDTMQTMPVFVYLIPVIMLWGSGPIAAIIATVVYAMPPIVRMTSLGLRLVPSEAVETSQSHGATPWQTLIHVKIPLAMASIKMGLNQTIIMAFAMVIVGGLVGGGGLGQEVYINSVYLRMGHGFVAGISIVLMAMILDRASHGRTSKTHNLEPVG